ncbi:MAG TPA: LytTR family DNA-binding domain-containing protein [Bacteroidia bacterium]|nr:LytTR family DNA-binding domain-containing protein [Bacteroidia bacterium]
MVFDAIIVDDEPKSREVLRALISRYCPNVKIVGLAANIVDAKNLISKFSPSLVFLDVEMPGGNGFRLLDEVDRKKFDIIFVTSYGHYAIPALRYSAIDYLLKPVEIEELREAVQRVVQKRNSLSDDGENYKVLSGNLKAPVSLQKIAIHGLNDVKFIPVAEIIRMEADNNYTFIITFSGDRYLASRTMKDFEEMLSGMRNFFRVHKTHLVNLNHIRKFVKGDSPYIVMSDGSNIEVSRRKKQELIERMGVNS